MTAGARAAEGAAAAGRLVATTRPLERDVDLLAVAGRSGALWTRGRGGLAGRGIATWVDVPAGDPALAAAAVAEVLGRFEVDDTVGLPGCGPVAMGALPFDPALPGRMAVAEITVGRAPDGTRWITTLGDPAAADRHGLPGTGHESGTAQEPTRFEVRSARPAEEWVATVDDVRSLLLAEREGGAPDRLRKVVLAREVRVEADRPLAVDVVLARLARTYPSCMLYRTPGDRPLVGASPELLVARLGEVVRAHPLAGTAPRSGDPSTDARLAAGLISSTKDQEEHRITIDMVHDTLLPWCSYLDEEAEPSVVAMANVQHLGTVVEGKLLSPPAHVIELVRSLHPTPAVGGAPRAAALATIAAHEGMDRGSYGGPVGWVDASGNGEFAVGIRCAEIDGSTARLFAGVGVLADSEPEAELAETRAKLQALLSAIVRP